MSKYTQRCIKENIKHQLETSKPLPPANKHIRTQLAKKIVKSRKQKCCLINPFTICNLTHDKVTTYRNCFEKCLNLSQLGL